MLTISHDVNWRPNVSLRSLFVHGIAKWNWLVGWLAAASLGECPEWRVHLYVHGGLGSGKSSLIELAACLLGDLAGEVVNDATEAGLRQSRNNQARPLLIDEFEPDDNSRNASRQDAILGLFRRMSGGAGGRISRGGADHASVSFRALGAAYVTSINHIHLEPQDRSRFVLRELGALPNDGDPAKAAANLSNLVGWCRNNSGMFRGKMLAQSRYWDTTHATIAARAQALGANERQAQTAATILAGLDLLLFDGGIDNQRLEDLEGLTRALISDAGESNENSEGHDALDYLLGTVLTLDQGARRTVRELLVAAISNESCVGVDSPSEALARSEIFIMPDKRRVALRVGRAGPLSKLFADTKWCNGAHASALKKLDGVERPSSPVRVAPNQQHRVLLIPFDLVQLPPKS